MKGSQPHLEHVFQQKLRPQSGDGAESETSLPSLDSEYVPYRHSNAPEFSLVCIKSDGVLRGFQYVHLDSASEFSPECITLRFMGLSATQVTIQGRNLRELFDYIHQHRVAWAREAARPYAEDDEPIISRITITPLKLVETTN